MQHCNEGKENIEAARTPTLPRRTNVARGVWVERAPRSARLTRISGPLIACAIGSSLTEIRNSSLTTPGASLCPELTAGDNGGNRGGSCGSVPRAFARRAHATCRAMWLLPIV
eukprot:360667-Chlamydomonas_euryale.AAC.12